MSQTFPAPVLNLITPGGTRLSGIIPSLDFGLQQSEDLPTWAAVTNPPELNPPNLQNQVTLPEHGGHRFFRLMR